MASKYTTDEFLTSIRDKFPMYVEWDDSLLLESLLDKYPTYKEQISDYKESGEVALEEIQANEEGGLKEETEEAVVDEVVETKPFGFIKKQDEPIDTSGLIKSEPKYESEELNQEDIAISERVDTSASIMAPPVMQHTPFQQEPPERRELTEEDVKQIIRERVKSGESKFYSVSTVNAPDMEGALLDTEADWSEVNLDELIPGDTITFTNRDMDVDSSTHHTIKSFREIEVLRETQRRNKLYNEIKNDPMMTYIPGLGDTPVKAALDLVEYKFNELMSLGLSKREWFPVGLQTGRERETGERGKPPLLELMDIQNQETEWTDDTALGKTARVFRGVGETSGGLAKIVAFMQTAGLLGLGESATGAIGFGTLGGVSRLTDPEIAKDMTPRKWIVGTGLDVLLGAAFPYLGRIGERL